MLCQAMQFVIGLCLCDGVQVIHFKFFEIQICTFSKLLYDFCFKIAIGRRWADIIF